MYRRGQDLGRGKTPMQFVNLWRRGALPLLSLVHGGGAPRGCCAHPPCFECTFLGPESSSVHEERKKVHCISTDEDTQSRSWYCRQYFSRSVYFAGLLRRFLVLVYLVRQHMSGKLGDRFSYLLSIFAQCLGTWCHQYIAFFFYIFVEGLTKKPVILWREYLFTKRYNFRSKIYYRILLKIYCYIY